MEALGSLCAIAAGAVLMISGLAKVGRTAQFRRSLVDFGLPNVFWRGSFFARAFPWVEMIVATAMIIGPSPGSWIARLAALALFVGFTAVTAGSVVRGTRVNCECFGGFGSTEVTRRTVLRNLVLSAIAAASLVSPVSVPEARGAVIAVLSLAIATAIGIATLVLRPRTRTVGPPEEFGEIFVVDHSGARLNVEEFREPPTFVVFFSAGCGGCSALMERFRWWPHALREGFDLQPIFLGSPAEFASHEEFAPLVEHAWYDPSRTFAQAVGLTATPAMVLIDRQHPLGTGCITGTRKMEVAMARDGFHQEMAAEQND